MVDETLPNCGEAACGKPWVDQNIGRTFAVTRRIGWDRRGKKRCQTACKPGSVPARGAGDDHSSGPPIAGRFSRPTRASRAVNPADRSPRDAPIRSCSRRGLPCRPRYRSRGGLLPHPFTLPDPAGPEVCFLWRYPSGHPGRALPAAFSPWSPDFPRQGEPRRDRPAVWRALGEPPDTPRQLAGPRRAC